MYMLVDLKMSLLGLDLLNYIKITVFKHYQKIISQCIFFIEYNNKPVLTKCVVVLHMNSLI